MSDLSHVRPMVPDFWRRLWLRGGLVQPNSSELRWLLAELETPGGVRRVQIASAWLIPFAVFWIVSGLSTFGMDAMWALGVAGAIAACSVIVHLLRPAPVNGLKKHRFGLRPDDDCTLDDVDQEQVRRQVRRSRLIGGLAMAGLVLAGFNAVASPTEPMVVIDEVSCTDGDVVELTAVIRNTTDNATVVGPLRGVVEVETGERFEGTVRFEVGPGEVKERVIEADLVGAVTSCEASV